MQEFSFNLMVKAPYIDQDCPSDVIVFFFFWTTSWGID